MLVGDKNRVEGARLFTRGLHALEEFSAGDARIDENPGARAGDNRAVAPGTAGQHSHTNHAVRIRLMCVEDRAETRPGICLGYMRPICERQLASHSAARGRRSAKRGAMTGSHTAPGRWRGGRKGAI